MKTELEQLIPLVRLAGSGEIGATIKFVASNGAACITGTFMTVDGGASAAQER